MSLTQRAPTYLAAIEEEIANVVALSPAHLRDYTAMLEYHLGLDNAHARGKRLRPLLCLLCCEAAGGAWQTAVPMAAAIELLHNFSLIHDDIQDNSPLRRGRPSVWQKWGPAQAINAGDAMFTLAHLAPQRLTALGVAPGAALEALAEFDRTCLRLTQGQHLDIAFEQRPRVTVSEYVEMIEAKTAALIAAATGLGALLAGAGAAVRAHFYGFGRSLGLAFQAQDDLLGIWGDPAVTGKSAASDLVQRKKSLPVVYGLEHSDEFSQTYAQPHPPSASVDTLASTLEALGARAFAEGQARTWTTEARAHLEAAAGPGPAAAALRELCAQLTQRDK